MKKAIYIAIALLGTAALSSCQKTEVIEKTYYNNARSLWFEVGSNQWTADANQGLWSYSRNIPEIDDLIFENGTVLVDISFGDGIFEPLTSVYEGLAYRYDYEIGRLWIDVTWADGQGGTVGRPGDITLKVILLDGDPLN